MVLSYTQVFSFGFFSLLAFVCKKNLKWYSNISKPSNLEALASSLEDVSQNSQTRNFQDLIRGHLLPAKVLS